MIAALRPGAHSSLTESGPGPTCPSGKLYGTRSQHHLFDHSYGPAVATPSSFFGTHTGKHARAVLTGQSICTLLRVCTSSQCIIHNPCVCAHVCAQCCTCPHPPNAAYTPHVHVHRCVHSLACAHTLPKHQTHTMCMCTGARLVQHRPAPSQCSIHTLHAKCVQCCTCAQPPNAHTTCMCASAQVRKECRTCARNYRTCVHPSNAS